MHHTRSSSLEFSLWSAFGPPCGFGYCLFQGGGSVVVDSMLIGTPIVGFCNSCFVARYFMSILNLQSS